MKITVTGSLGHISKSLTQKLVAAGHEVKVVSSDVNKADQIKAIGATPLIGSIQDVNFLVDAFKDADAIYTMVPPYFNADNWKAHIAKMGANYAEAITKAGVKNVVNLSSVGAHLAVGCGPVSGLYHVEQSLNALEGVNVRHLRPGFFFYNFYSNVDLIKHAGILGSNYPADAKMVMVDTEDIADAAFEELNQLSFTGKSFKYVVSDVRTPKEVAAVLGAAIGKPDLPWVAFSDTDLQAALVQHGLGEDIAANFVEMGTAIANGKMTEDFGNGEVTGKVKLEDFAKVFANSFDVAVGR